HALDRQRAGTGGGHVEPQPQGLRAVGTDRGDLAEAVRLGVPEDAHADVLREPLPDVLDGDRRVRPFVQSDRPDVDVGFHARREQLRGLPGAPVGLLRPLDPPAGIALVQLPRSGALPFRDLPADADLPTVAERRSRLVPPYAP